MTNLVKALHDAIDVLGIEGLCHIVECIASVLGLALDIRSICIQDGIGKDDKADD